MKNIKKLSIMISLSLMSVVGLSVCDSSNGEATTTIEKSSSSSTSSETLRTTDNKESDKNKESEEKTVDPKHGFSNPWNDYESLMTRCNGEDLVYFLE